MNNKVRQAANSLREFLVGLPRPAKSAIAFTADLIGFGLCVLAALWLLALGPYAISHTLIIAATALVSVFLAWWQDMYRSVVRYMGLDLFIAGARTALGSAIAGAVLMNFFVFGGTPRRWAIAYALFSFIYICGSRYIARWFLVNQRARKRRERVIIYGAGSAGVQLTTNLLSGDEYLPVAMLDCDAALYGKKVKGLEVYPPSEIETVCRESGAKHVLLAMPRIRRQRRRQILEHLSEFSVRVQTIPDFGDIVSGKARVDDISDVNVEDLLGREPVPPNSRLLAASITGKNVMVTGAGGSIGSELCHQILKLNPKRIVCFEISEAALYPIDKDLRRLAKLSKSRCEIVALLGSVYHERRMREAIEVFDIQSIYHAAAYKHVPIVEQNLFEGIHNNIFGTWHTARAAADAGVETFVLISTDKAVNPTSVMGATKRMAELILQAMNEREKHMRICMVRFGNVLESSGSVVPLFREQIRNGGPVTLTHQDIIRYFMTIPEAAQLVIQAAAMAKGGDVFVLDMGKPVRIEDLAYRMINLMGFTVRNQSNPDGDIEIEYIGLRPAEKLYEELLIGSNVSGTDHPRIMRADEDYLPFDVLTGMLEELQDASTNLDYNKARDILRRAVKEYTPDNGIDDLVWIHKTGTDASPPFGTVVDFPHPNT